VRPFRRSRKLLARGVQAVGEEIDVQAQDCRRQAPIRGLLRWQGVESIRARLAILAPSQDRAGAKDRMLLLLLLLLLLRSECHRTSCLFCSVFRLVGM
jgi:hypothetical protein